MQGRGFEPLKAEPAGLQPAPFGHSGTPAAGAIVTASLGRAPVIEVARVRAAIGSTGLALVVALAVGAAVPTVPAGGAATASRRDVTAVIADGPHGAAAARVPTAARGRAAVGAPRRHGCHRLAGRRVASRSRARATAAARSTSPTRQRAASAASPTTRRRRMSNRPGRLTVGASCGRADRRARTTCSSMDRRRRHKRRLAGGRRQRRRPRLVAGRLAHRVRLESERTLPAVARRLLRRERRGSRRRARCRARAPSGARRHRLRTQGSSHGKPTCGCVSLDGLLRAAPTTAPSFDGRPDWSPDGRRLAFVSERGGAQRIWLMRADGSPAAAAGLAAGRRHPDWSVARRRDQPRARPSCCRISTSSAPSGLLVMQRTGARPSSASPRPSTTSVPARSTSEALVSGPLARCGPISSSTGAAAGCASCARSDARRTSRIRHTTIGTCSRTSAMSSAGRATTHSSPGTARAASAFSTAGVMPGRSPGSCPDPSDSSGDCAAGEPAGTPGRGGVLDRIHRSLPRVLPRAGDRHHGPRRRPLRAGAPGEPGGTDSRAALLQQCSVRAHPSAPGERDSRPRRRDPAPLRELGAVPSQDPVVPTMTS